MKRFIGLFAVLAVFFAGCATIGHEFNTANVSQIKIGTTTQNNVLEMFGMPWRTGIEDGYPTWTYGKYHYSAFSEPTTTDLVVRFDNKLVVTSYTFNTTEVSPPPAAADNK